MGHRSTHRVDWLWLGNNVPECPSCCRDVLFGFISSGLCLFCIVLCCAVPPLTFMAISRTHTGQEGRGGKKWLHLTNGQTFVSHQTQKNPNLKVGEFLTNQNLARGLIQTIWEEKIICTVKCQLFLYKQVTAKRHDLKYGISAKSAKYYH